jgi:hypothetical protein
MWKFGNGGIPDFHEAAENHFQPFWWKCKKPRETAISTFPGIFSRTLKAAGRVDITTDPVNPPRAKSLARGSI